MILRISEWYAPIHLCYKLIRLLKNNESANKESEKKQTEFIKTLSWENIVSHFEVDLHNELSKLNSCDNF